MTLKELKETIAASANKDWLQNYELDINYSHIHYKTTLKGVVNIYEFIINQADGYSNYSNTNIQLPDELEKVRQRFITAKGNLLNLISQDNVNKDSWDQLLNLIAKNSSHAIFLYNSAEVDFLIRTFQVNRDFYPGVYEYLTGFTSRVTQRNYLTGYLLAYEFVCKDFSKIAERREVEKKSILKTAIEFQTKLGEAQKEVIEFFSKTNEKHQEYIAAIDLFKSEKDKTFNDWFNKTTDSFSKFNADSNTQINELEFLYKEKLKLEAPAKYWSDRAMKLRKEGNSWLVGLIACIVVACSVLVWVLNKTADGTLQKIFSETSTAIKWSVVLITLISFLAYGIRMFSKLTFSSFHLVRDAEEREQLTYVYLALQKEKGIDQTERHLIMQSLFSRADSGLLKDDSGPTMPGHIMDQVTKR